jgi:hypothetical protein
MNLLPPIGFVTGHEWKSWECDDLLAEATLPPERCRCDPCSPRGFGTDGSALTAHITIDDSAEVFPADHSLMDCTIFQHFVRSGAGCTDPVALPCSPRPPYAQVATLTVSRIFCRPLASLRCWVEKGAVYDDIGYFGSLNITTCENLGSQTEVTSEVTIAGDTAMFTTAAHDVYCIENGLYINVRWLYTLA